MTKTNLITGFLGSGKTTSILHLLAHKDPAEKWAVLVMNLAKWVLTARCLPTARTAKRDPRRLHVLRQRIAYAGGAQHAATPGQT